MILREYIKALVNENEELLKKWSQDNNKKGYSLLGNETDESVLVKLGLTPIPHGSESSLLGAGGFQTAYEVLWNGKRVVAKLTKSEIDVKNTIKLDEIGRSSPNFAKHIMKVYDVLEYKNLYCMLVEYLVKIPESLLNDLYGIDLFSNNSELNPYKKEELESISYDDIKRIVESSISNMKSIKFSKEFFNSYELENLIKSISDNLLNNIIITNKYDSVYYAIKYNDFINELLPQAKKLSDSSPIAFLRFILTDLEQFINRKVFPESSKDDKWKIKKALMHKDPRVREFIKFLINLKDQYELDWRDLHGGNIMMRSKSNEIVIVDPGLFVL